MSNLLPDANLDPVREEESSGGRKLSNLKANGMPPGSDKGGASFGSFQLNQVNAENFVKNSKWADEFEGIKLGTPRGNRAFERVWKRLDASDPDFRKAEEKEALNLPNTKQALRFAQQLAGEKELTPNLKGYAAGVGINMGDASAQWHILQPLKMYAEGTLTESEALKQMALRRTQVNQRFDNPQLFERNMREPGLFDPSIDREEMEKMVRGVVKNKRSSDDLMLEMIDAMPPEEREKYLESSASKKWKRGIKYKQYKDKQKRMREAQLREVYKVMSGALLRGRP